MKPYSFPGFVVAFASMSSDPSGRRFTTVRNASLCFFTNSYGPPGLPEVDLGGAFRVLKGIFNCVFGIALSCLAKSRFQVQKTSLLTIKCKLC